MALLFCLCGRLLHGFYCVLPWLQQLNSIGSQKARPNFGEATFALRALRPVSEPGLSALHLTQEAVGLA
jgi:hypothetical protein